MPLLHGHVHTRNRVTRTDDGTPQIHVGQDAWDFTPASLETVTDLLLDSVGTGSRSPSPGWRSDPPLDERL